jgi:dihydroxyacetone kinase-like predicted kinase
VREARAQDFTAAPPLPDPSSIGAGGAGGDRSRMAGAMSARSDHLGIATARTRATAVAEVPSPGQHAGGAASAPSLAVIAVAAGDGLVRIFHSFGVERVVRPGGRSTNPSTGQLLAAIHASASQEVLILPNDPNVNLAAAQAGSMAEGRHVVVVPTRNAAEGFAALLALDPALDAEANRAPMQAAILAIQTLQVTVAARDATIGDRTVRQGQTIALDVDDGLVAIEDDPLKAVLAGVDSFEPGFELLTVYYGEGADLARAQVLARELRSAHPGAEVEVQHGGQPHYSYLISAE